MIDEITQALVDVLKSDVEFLKPENVWYGDQATIPRTPAAVVDPTPGIVSELTATGHQLDHTTDIDIIIYHSEMSARMTRKVCNQFAEEVRQALHNPTRRKLGGLVVYSYVHRTEPGYARVGQKIYYGTRLAWRGTSREMMPHG